MRGLSIWGVFTAATLAVGVVPTEALAASTVRIVGPQEATGEDARSLYEAGERAYRRGRFPEALEKFERAYDLSEQPLLLYNIALAYRQLYDVAQDVEELRRGRAVLKNFMLFAERDADLDPTDARRLLTEIETLIADHKERKPEVVPPPGPISGSDDPPPTASNPGDPGRELRIAGAIAMGSGGALALAGTIAGIVFGIKGENFAADLERDTKRHEEECGGASPTLSDADCDMLNENIDVDRSNGRNANLGVGLSFGVGGGLGVIAFGVGLGLFIQGNKRSNDWRATSARRPRVYPIATRDGAGFGVSGRF